jgi:hypothetical protein
LRELSACDDVLRCLVQLDVVVLGVAEQHTEGFVVAQVEALHQDALRSSGHGPSRDRLVEKGVPAGSIEGDCGDIDPIVAPHPMHAGELVSEQVPGVLGHSVGRALRCRCAAEVQCYAREDLGGQSAVRGWVCCASRRRRSRGSWCRTTALGRRVAIMLESGLAVTGAAQQA